MWEKDMFIVDLNNNNRPIQERLLPEIIYI